MAERPIEQTHVRVNRDGLATSDRRTKGGKPREPGPKIGNADDSDGLFCSEEVQEKARQKYRSYLPARVREHTTDALDLKKEKGN